MIAGTGSALWLVRHELRLLWRAGLVKGVSSVFLIVAILLMHVVAAAIAFKFGDAPPMPQGLRLQLVTGLLSVGFLLMLSRCLQRVFEAIYTRRDTDLLLTSPLAPASFVGARAMGIAITVTLEFSALLFPFANIFVILGNIDWLKVYLLVPVFAVLTVTLTLLCILGMFRLLGPKRTLVFGQIMSTLVGLSMMLMLAPSLIPRQITLGFSTLSRQSADTGTALIWRPASLILNGFAPTLIFAVGCIVLFVTTLKALGSLYVSASLLATGISKGSRRPQCVKTMAFRSNPHKILVSKELRLIARDPTLLTELSKPLAIAIPLALTLWKLQSDGTPWMWISLILISGSFASALSWLIFTAEDAPDLLASSPLSRKIILRAKVEAALTPLLILISLPLFVLLKQHPVFAVALVVCSAGCAASCALLNVGGRSAQNRADFNRRHKGAPGSGIVEILVIVGWMLLCAAIMWLSPWA